MSVMALYLPRRRMNSALTWAYEQFITTGMDLVAELKDLRETRKISQATVAAAVGVDQSAISHWEQGKSKPSGSARKLLERFVARERAKAKAAVAQEASAA